MDERKLKQFNQKYDQIMNGVNIYDEGYYIFIN